MCEFLRILYSPLNTTKYGNANIEWYIHRFNTVRLLIVLNCLFCLPQFLAKHDRQGGEIVLEEVSDTSVTLGYCPDYSADMNVGVAMERLLVSSQDVAHDKEKLKELGVTHVLNVAYGVPNIFPEVSMHY